MGEPLLVHEGDLVRGEVLDRPNRFVLEVDFGEGPERVFLGDPGALEVLEPGSEVLCEPVDDEGRKTDYDAVSVLYGDIHVSLKAALANDLFAAIVSSNRIPAFEGYDIRKREPQLPEHGRADFLLERTGDGGEAQSEGVFVEVKSCTHAENGVGKFPDRPTERGRRHLRSLLDLAADGIECHLVFVVQRPDVDVFRPYRSVDPEFADILKDVRASPVTTHAVSIEFDPPEYLLDSASIPIETSD